MPPTLSYRAALPGQLLRAALYLGVIALLHFTHWFILAPAIRWTLVAIIIVGAFVPPRFSELASGTGMLIVAAVAYFYYGSTGVAAICGIFGAITLAMGFRSLTRA